MSLTNLYNELMQDEDGFEKVAEDNIYSEAEEIVKIAEDQVEGLMKTAAEYMDAGAQMYHNELNALIKEAMDYGLTEYELQKIAEETVGGEEEEEEEEEEEKAEKKKEATKEQIKEAMYRDPEYLQQVLAKYSR
jgi:hypothetical protein